MIAEIAQKLTELLPTIEVDGDTLFVDVLAHPVQDDNELTGFPSASFFYESTDSDYSTVDSNRRNLMFSIWVYGIWEELGIDAQYAAMYGMIDAVLDALDNSSDLGLSNVLIRPVPSELRRVTIPQGTGLMSRIRLECSYDAVANG